MFKSKAGSVIKFRQKGGRVDRIEILLQTTVVDDRYLCMWRILIPYLTNIRRLTEHEVISIITEWLDKCNKVNRIRWEYPKRIEVQLKYDKGYSHISIENLKNEKLELYNLLHKK